MIKGLKMTTVGVALAMAMGVASADMPKEVNIAYVKSPFNIQNMVIKDQQLLEKAFAKHGTKVVWHTINSGAKQTQAMAAGSLDVSAVMNTASLLAANGEGNKVVVIVIYYETDSTLCILVHNGECSFI